MNALKSLLETFRKAAASHREHGTYFEELTVGYLRHEPAYDSWSTASPPSAG